MNNMNMVHVNIPNEWKWMKLGEISKIYDGTHQTPNYVENGVPFYSVEHVTANDFSQTKYILEDVYAREARRTSIERGDILMTRIGDVGTARHIDWDVRASFYVSLALIKCKEDFNSKFVCYLINSYNFQRELWQKTIHVAFPNKINLGDIGRCKMVIPLLIEQNRIVEILETWDQVIQKLSQKIEKKKNIKKGLMQKLLTGKARLPGFTEKWETVELQDVCSVSMGQSPASSAYNGEGAGIPLIQGNNDIKKRKTIARVWTTEITRAAARGDIIMTVRAPVGLIGVATTDVCIGRGVCAIRATSAEQGFILKFLESFEKRWRAFEQGSTFTAVNSADVKGLLINIPSSKLEQSAIADILTAADREIEIFELKYKVLKEQKRYLLNNLITGNIRVPESIKVNQ